MGFYKMLVTLILVICLKPHINALDSKSVLQAVSAIKEQMKTVRDLSTLNQLSDQLSVLAQQFPVGKSRVVDQAYRSTQSIYINQLNRLTDSAAAQEPTNNQPVMRKLQFTTRSQNRMSFQPGMITRQNLGRLAENNKGVDATPPRSPEQELN